MPFKHSTKMALISQSSISFLVNTIRTDGMVNATALTTAYRKATVSEANTSGIRKDVRDWLLTPDAKASIAYLERVTGIPVTDLVIAEHGIGTWLHPDLAEILAQWISVEYRFAVVALIRQAKSEPVPVEVPRQLPPVRDTTELLATAQGINDLADPLMRSLLNQRMFEELGSKSLPASTIATQVVLTVRASDLGYKLNQIGSGSQLGKFVSRLIAPTGKTQHGRYPVNVYDLTPDLDDCIHAYFR
jgi:hypothetical protein